MGVDFFPCDVCGESICDCGDYVRCSCGRRWCSLGCAVDDGYILGPLACDDDDTCAFCRGEDVETMELFAFALTKLNITRQQLVKEYIKINPVMEDDDE